MRIQYLIIPATFAISAAVSFVISHYRGRWTVMDRPNERSLHTSPTPRLGGLGIIAGILVAFILCWLFINSAVMTSWLWILAGFMIVMVVSLLDDIYKVPVLIRLLVHLAAALILVSGGVSLSALLFPGLIISASGFTGIVFSIIFVVWMTNLYNFMDGMDGLAAGMGIIGFGTFAILGWSSGAWFFVQINACIAAACGGFLWLNFPPAKIFMGDVGAASLGFLAAALTLWASNHNVFPIWVGVVAFLPFILDATWTLLRRVFSGKKFWYAHQEHLYQRMIQLGWGQRRVILGEYVVMLGCSFSAIILYMTDQYLIQIIGLGFILSVLLGLIFSVQLLDARRKQGESQV